ncbi:hypothetical protein V5O48_011601, partial [Marasmius crinis-equi]
MKNDRDGVRLLDRIHDTLVHRSRKSETLVVWEWEKDVGYVRMPRDSSSTLPDEKPTFSLQSLEQNELLFEAMIKYRMDWTSVFAEILQQL